MIERVRRLRYMEEEVTIPDAYQASTIEVRTPIVNDQIQRLVNQLTFNPFTIRQTAPRPGPEAQRRSSRVEKGLQALYERLVDDGGKNLFYRATDKAVETGEAIVKVTLRTDRWTEMPKKPSKGEDDEQFLGRITEFKRGAGIPIVARVIDRATWYPEYDEDGLARCVEVTKRRAHLLWKSFGTEYIAAHIAAGLPVPDNSSYSVGQEVTLVEYWDRDYAVYILADGLGGHYQRGGILRSFRHGYREIPYFNGYGDETSSDDPNYEALSAAFPIMYMVPFLNALYTMWSNVAFVTGYPTVTETTPSDLHEAMVDEDTDEDLSQNIDIEPGKILRGVPGTKWDVLNFGPLSSALTGMVAETKGIIQSAMLPSSMQGIPPGSRTSGYAIQELVAAAKAKYAITVSNLERLFSRMFSFCLWLVEKKIRQPLELMADKKDKNGAKYRGFVKLDPDDIRGYYKVECKIQPRNPEDRIREGTFMANMHTAGLVSKRMAIEEGLGKEQPDEVIDEIMVEQWMERPEIQDFIVQQALQKAGIPGFLEDTMAASQMYQDQMAALGGAAQNLLPVAGGGGGAPGANGMVAGQAQPDAMSVTAPTAPGMEAPGMPAAMGMGMGMQNPFGPKMPRMYRKSGPAEGSAQRQPARPGIAGFRGR